MSGTLINSAQINGGFSPCGGFLQSTQGGNFSTSGFGVLSGHAFDLYFGGAAYSASSGSGLMPGTAGTYLIEAAVGTNSSAVGLIQAGMGKNGSVVWASAANTTANGGVARMTAIMILGASDVVNLMGQASTTMAVNDSWCQLTVVRIA